MSGKFYRLFLGVGAMVLMFAATGCDTVLQYPDEPDTRLDDQSKNVYLTIEVDDVFKLLGEYEYDYETQSAWGVARSKHLQAARASHQFRLILNAYDAADKSVHPKVLFTETLTQPVTTGLNRTRMLRVMPGNYRFVMWIDYVDEGSQLDKYYSTGEFAEIILNNDGGHYGSNDYRDAFYGETMVNIPEMTDGDIHACINLGRPMAKYTFISDDFREFYDNELSSGRVSATQGPSRAPDLSDYLVRVVYTRYMPCAFNAHTGKPADSRLGVEYHSLISVMDEDRAQLAFDYIFTNGTQTSVSVAMEVLYKDGAVVSRMPTFDVPLKRSHQTFVTGKFLTTKSGGPIGIDPGFEDDFNIEIK